MNKKTETEFTTLKRSPVIWFCQLCVARKENTTKWHDWNRGNTCRLLLHMKHNSILKNLNKVAQMRLEWQRWFVLICRYAGFVFKGLSQTNMILNLLRQYKEKGVICTLHTLWFTDIIKMILFYIHSNDSLLSPDVLVLPGCAFALFRCVRYHFFPHKVWVT